MKETKVRTGSIAGAFARGKETMRPLFIGFTVAGDPDQAGSLNVVRSMIEGGADIIELGVPFSDPVADGPVIQQADQRALVSGMNTDRLFDLVRDIRKESDLPIVLLVHANTVYRRGIDRFYSEASDAGVNGILVADLPVEEADEYIAAAYANGIDPIMMITLTTTPDRMDKILSVARGFVYLVTVCGVTGARKDFHQESMDLIATVRKHTTLPLAPGFGISTSAQIKAFYSAGADAVIVGSAIVQRIGDHIGDISAICSAVKAYIKEMVTSRQV